MKSFLLILLASVSLNSGWRFAFGNTSDPQKDFGCGTEYFNYLTKAASIHNEGPYSFRFNDSTWQEVTIPHDWVPSLPFAPEASHSHGYHTVGWRYPETSVGWYRKLFVPTEEMLNGPTRLVFEGIFRDARVWLNGFYMGREESGYAQQVYDITDYLIAGEDNLICVRVDASLEEGWFYEGAGIYRPVRIETGTPSAPVPSPELARYMWSPDSGFMVDGHKVALHGVNLHQDHAGVGVAIPKGLWEYRLRKMQELGVNAIRTSHNPIAPDVLDLCDSLGIYVLEETRLLGTSEPQLRVLKNMIERDMHHKSIILWGVGNEEWGVEWKPVGERIAAHMQDCVHLWDPSRKAVVATSSGPNIVRSMDVAGYNYLVQNDIDGERMRYPNRCAVGTEETTGCGTRGVYYPDPTGAHMPSMNYPHDTIGDGICIIERGIHFYDERPWLGGLFFWTGFDYTGEPNPLSWPAVCSEFGLLDLCGFKKDEAYYLQSCWTDTPVLHILPHWNLQGHEGETVEVWVYSNMDEVELRVNGRSLGRKRMPYHGHLSWTAVYKPGRVEAVGYKKGKRVTTTTIYTAGPAAQLATEVSRYDDITVVDISALDAKGHFCPTACEVLHLEVTAGRLLGFGNGDPACHATFNANQPFPAEGLSVALFNGHAQLIFQGETPVYTIRL